MTSPSFQMRNGVPTSSEYQELIGSPDFQQMEKFSDQFVSANAETLRPYMKKWITDPLHQWSRQWEYPFVYSRIEPANGSEKLRILDAGSGATFFPFYLQQQNPSAEVACCDYDKTLSPLYDSINKTQNANIKFSVADLRQLPFEDESVDTVYCVSVLEHTDAYETIINEFRRVVRPGGRIVITFDISLDGKHDIPEAKAEQLLSLIIKGNEESDAFPTVQSQLQQPSIVSTDWFAESQADLLPWSRPGLLQHAKSLIKSGQLRKWPNSLTFYCLSVEK
ncbi:Demethylrebeccamycin-D-glucose O-methyltransferase [Rubripirellula amarantea]|uniref:Demethylrebeccamycin-D-glucose O-methyltransferase n=1 Tax=Rubripirellula amarantea TaxID=2527999 RepID=A0A5C5WB79_9BACT|nr:class I SAM-dependent methyltransferase [Rubripirellula amarantea]TWT48166.1 Demethylrebeccamycin-D-glucose O-methyltransferase [Rubripirellula amarantea]